MQKEEDKDVKKKPTTVTCVDGRWKCPVCARQNPVERKQCSICYCDLMKYTAKHSLKMVGFDSEEKDDPIVNGALVTISTSNAVTVKQSAKSSRDRRAVVPLRRRRPKAGSKPNESVAPLNCDDESLRLAVAIATARFVLCVLGFTCWSLKQRETHLVGNCTVISDPTPSPPTLV